jgi:hypothetical protein
MKNKTSLFASCVLALSVAGCGGTLRQDMANQPRQNPLSPSSFFQDGRSARPEIDNTVIHGATAQDTIFCSPCHGLQGDGNGMVTLRGMKHPPTYHQDRLRNVPNGYLFDVVTNGFGAMNGYSAQIDPRDRWAVVAYVRALQVSRNAHVADLPANLKEKLMAGGSGK